MKEITLEEYNKAYEIVKRYEYQMKGTIQVAVTYDAKVSATIQVPHDWDIKKIKEELKTGYYDFKENEEPDTELGEITELIVDGEEVDL